MACVWVREKWSAHKFWGAALAHTHPNLVLKVVFGTLLAEL